MCGVCAWGQGRDSTWDWERLVCGAGWRLGGPFLFLEGWWGTQVSRASWACRPGPVRAQIAGCSKRGRQRRFGRSEESAARARSTAWPGSPGPPSRACSHPVSRRWEKLLPPTRLRLLCLASCACPCSQPPPARAGTSPEGTPPSKSTPRVLSSAVLRPGCPRKAVGHGAIAGTWIRALSSSGTSPSSPTAAAATAAIPGPGVAGSGQTVSLWG